MVKDLEAKFKHPIAGSLRIGEKNEKNIPKKLDYFTVHEDSHTITDVVNQFNSKYNKPKELIIRFITDDPFETSYLRYGKSGLLCKGDGESANCRGEKDWLECECSKDCTHRGKDCFLTGRLYFLIKGINIGGLWRLQTQSYNTIQNFLTILNFLKCMGIDIKQKEFRIATEENTRVVDGKVNKYTTISLKMLEGSSKTKVEENNTEPKNKEITAKPKETKAEKEKAESKVVPTKEEAKQKENVQPKAEAQKTEVASDDDYEKCLTLVELKDITRGEKTGKQAVFCNMKDELIEVLIHPDIVEEVCKWEVASAIIPVNIYEQNNYKILKEFKDVAIIKKAV